MNESGARAPIMLGFANLTASPGDHIGHFYRTTQEWKAVVVDYLSTGLDGGDKCVCLATNEAEAQVLAALDERGVDTATALQTRRLVFSRGYDDTAPLQRMLSACLDEVAGKDQVLRWVGDMTWSHGQMPSCEALMEWETACNVVGDAPVVFLCQYDISRFPGNVVIDALKTHPLCIVGEIIHRNAFYQDPESYLSEIRSRENSPLGMP